MRSVPMRLIRYEVVDGEVVPSYLGPADVPWLRDLLDGFETFVGAPRQELDAHLVRPAGRAMYELARHVLFQEYKPEIVAAVNPRLARRKLFVAAAAAAKATAIAATAESLGVGEDELLTALFADLSAERRVSSPPAPITPEHLIALCNTAIVRAIVRRSVVVDLTLTGHSRAIVRHAKLRGLLCEVQATGGNGDADGDTCCLRLSGPAALFAHTVRYGNALAELVTMLPWCRSFRFVARCRLGGEHDRLLRLVLTKSSSLLPSQAPRRFDSLLEARFAREFARATDAWELIREPEPVPAGDALIFPDFELRSVVSVQGERRRVWLELVGFWTVSYLEKKLARLRLAGLSRLILCVDEARVCDAAGIEELAQTVWYKRRIDVAEVLAALERLGP